MLLPLHADPLLSGRHTMVGAGAWVVLMLTDAVALFVDPPLPPVETKPLPR